MPRKANASRWTTGKVFGVGIALMFAALFIFGGPLQFLYETYSTDWMRTQPSDIDPDAQLVDLSIGLMMTLGRDVPAATPVDIYDANKVPIETRNSDATTGIATFQFDYWEGETVYIQVYVAGNAATGLVYMTELIEFVVPEGDVNGDSQLPTIMLREPSSSTAAPTLVITKQSGVGLSGTATNYLNETDTSINILINTVTGDSNFGLPRAVHDYRTGFDYLPGIWVRLVTNATMPFADPDLYWTEGTTYYYVWNVPMIANDGDIPGDGTYNLVLGAQSDFTVTQTSATNVSMVFDAFDWVRLNGFGEIDAASFMDLDTSFSVTAVTTRLVPA